MFSAPARKFYRGRADGNDVPAVNLIDGRARANVIDRDDDNDDLGFRPAAVFYIGLPHLCVDNRVQVTEIETV